MKQNMSHVDWTEAGVLQLHQRLRNIARYHSSYPNMTAGIFPLHEDPAVPISRSVQLYPLFSLSSFILRWLVKQILIIEVQLRWELDGNKNIAILLFNYLVPSLGLFPKHTIHMYRVRWIAGWHQRRPVWHFIMGISRLNFIRFMLNASLNCTHFL